MASLHTVLALLLSVLSVLLLLLLLLFYGDGHLVTRFVVVVVVVPLRLQLQNWIASARRQDVVQFELNLAGMLLRLLLRLCKWAWLSVKYEHRKLAQKRHSMPFNPFKGCEGVAQIEWTLATLLEANRVITFVPGHKFVRICLRAKGHTVPRTVPSPLCVGHPQSPV